MEASTTLKECDVWPEKSNREEKEEREENEGDLRVLGKGKK